MMKAECPNEESGRRRRQRAHMILSMFRHILPVIPVVSAALLFAGCNSTPTQQNPPKPYETTIIKGAGPNIKGAGSNSKEYFDVDSCANRLHSIEGQIIYYYARFHRLPNALEEL